MFLQRPKPFDDESLESFFIRVASKNGYDDIHRFLIAIKRFLNDQNNDIFATFPIDLKRINPYSSRNNSGTRIAALHKIALMTFNEQAEILSLAINKSSLNYSPSTTALVRANEVIPRSLLRRDTIPCCPACLLENGYASYLWHWKGYSYCHKHHTPLIFQCSCGVDYDYRESGLSACCRGCNTPVQIDLQINNSADMISDWLAGNSIDPLPDLPKSYRWGLIHWWSHITKAEFNHTSFIDFWQNWPVSFHELIEREIEFKLEHAVVDRQELKVKDILGDVLFSCIHLPERNLKYNIVLNALLSFVEDNLWQDDGFLANLRMNSIEVAIFLNCSRDQVVAMVEQRLLKPNRRTRPNQPFEFTDYLFYLGDVYCLWLAEFQTDEFNRTFLISRQ
ncbi:hypothetical protein EGH82_20795 [Vibrio ponticus]|uniref:TniQ domain-containing protein n=1 Tax=Vibrio ponticus TaxID=265668 RepID=A0A3N3DU73_9VIBR|nr:TniQ family protein [Vibrio ponticus]ROV57936.1 hypothetical protein EGH82_20795 [Vibrio ponticus]